MTRQLSSTLAVLMIGVLLSGCAADRPMIPRIEEPWWTVAGNPDLGDLNGPPKDRPNAVQQPVDFAVWPAADGTWQLWSCIRSTNCGGHTRLLYGWEGRRPTDPDWRPLGIRMQADPRYGEQPGGLQAPHVVLIDDVYHMFYGDWVNICLARGTDGKTFERWLYPSGKAGMFDEGDRSNARDAMVIRIGDKWHCYYTAHSRLFGGDKPVGSVYCRTSKDLRNWSESTIVARGGEAGTGASSAECPHVVYLNGYYYLFRTQQYKPPLTRVYRSTDPMDFGVDTDDKLICRLDVAAPEIVLHEGKYYIAALLPDIQGIRIARLRWVPDED